MSVNLPPAPTPPPVLVPEALARCRHCEIIVGVSGYKLIGLDGSLTCNRNTHGCGESCGFFCGCNPADWAHGPHEEAVR